MIAISIELSTSMTLKIRVDGETGGTAIFDEKTIQRAYDRQTDKKALLPTKL